VHCITSNFAIRRSLSYDSKSGSFPKDQQLPFSGPVFLTQGRASDGKSAARIQELNARLVKDHKHKHAIKMLDQKLLREVTCPQKSLYIIQQLSSMTRPSPPSHLCTYILSFSQFSPTKSVPSLNPSTTRS
jgi:hypothetical protein